jgi:hypothetical protein
VLVKVFACGIHRECSIAENVGVAVCGRCPDYQPLRRAEAKAV